MSQKKQSEVYCPLDKEEPYRDSEELTEVGTTSHLPIHTFHRRSLIIAVATSAILLLSTIQLLLTISLRVKPPITPTQHVSKDYGSPCGRSSNEALANNCHWEYGLTSWIPDECYNPVLDAEFLSFDIPFERYYDRGDGEGPDLTRPYKDMKELSENPGDHWMRKPYHAPHCMHAWKYLHFAWLNQTGVPRSVVQYSHTAHCSRAMMHNKADDLEWIGIQNTIESRYGRCIGPEELRNGEMPSLTGL